MAGVPDPFLKLPTYLAEVGTKASAEQLAQFRIHYDQLLRWNLKTNLTSIREPVDILRRHFAECAFLYKVLASHLGGESTIPGTLVDVGSGAGFPGLVMKVLSPGTRVVLVEAVYKKVAFLKEVAREASLTGVEVKSQRFEDLPPLDADWLTMRAVRLDAEMLDAVRRHVPRGTIAAFLGEDDATRIATSSPGLEIHSIPGSERRVIAIGQCSTWNIP